MRIWMGFAGILALTWGTGMPQAYAQRGLGDPSGVARQPVKPEVVSLSGEVREVKTEPCKMTTGRAILGTHVLLANAEGKTLNIHLGPAAAVDFVANRLSVGMELTVKAFRTAKMPEDHYVAQLLTLNGTTIRLRDESLRPLWAGREAIVPGSGRADWPRASRRPLGRGYGPGYGARRGWGRGYGWGRGRAAGRGAGFGGGRALIDRDRDGVCDNYEWRFGQR